MVQNYRSIQFLFLLTFLLLEPSSAPAQENRPLMTRKAGQRLPFVLTAAVRTDVAPKVDGKLDDACWSDAAVAGDFILYGGTGLASEQTEARALWDDSNLYLGMRCFDSNIGKLKRNVKEDGGRVFLDDCIEIFFIPPENSILAAAPSDERYFHICVNAAGARYDEVGYEAPERWSGKWVVKTSVHANRWEMELALPWSDVKTKPEDGTVWAINFNRGLPARGVVREYSGWSITFGGFHDPEHFGKMIFLARWPKPGAKSIGPEISARLVRSSKLDPLLARADVLVREAARNLRVLRNRTRSGPVIETLATATKLETEARAFRRALDAFSAAKLLASWEKLEASCQELERKAEGLSARAGFCSGLSPGQLAGREPVPDFLTFVLPAISNERVLPRSLPGRVLSGQTMKLTACPGEYESGSFGVYALKSLDAVRLEATALEGPGGIVAASAIDIRLVKVWYQAGHGIAFENIRILTPELLLKDDGLVQIDEERKANILKKDKDSIRDADTLQPFGISEGTTKQCWVTIHIPEGTRAGTYRGSIRVVPPRGAAGQVNLELRVLPFGLVEPNIICSIYYRAKLRDQAPQCNSEYKTEQQLLAEFKDMRAHGVTNPTVYQSPGPNLQRYFELRRQAGMQGGPLLMLGVGVSASMDQLKATVAQAKRNGFTDAYFYAADEQRGEALRKERLLFRTVHQAGGKVFVACYKDSYELVGDLLDLPIYSGKPDVEMGRAFHASGHLIGSYGHPQGGVEEPETYRRNYGFGLWKVGYDCACTYAYMHSFGHAWDDFDHAVYRDHNMAYPTVNGVIPTIQWEGYREGYDDLRYLATLEKLIKRASRMEGPGGEAARAARLWLLRMDPDKQPLDEIRAGIIERILKLQTSIRMN